MSGDPASWAKGERNRPKRKKNGERNKFCVFLQISVSLRAVNVDIYPFELRKWKDMLDVFLVQSISL
jgi:hypothetical protein